VAETQGDAEETLHAVAEQLADEWCTARTPLAVLLIPSAAHQCAVLAVQPMSTGIDVKLQFSSIMIQFKHRDKMHCLRHASFYIAH